MNTALTHCATSSAYSLLFLVLLSSFSWNSGDEKIVTKHWVSSADHFWRFLTWLLCCCRKTCCFLVPAGNQLFGFWTNFGQNGSKLGAWTGRKPVPCWWKRGNSELSQICSFIKLFSLFYLHVLMSSLIDLVSSCSRELFSGKSPRKPTVYHQLSTKQLTNKVRD